MKQSARIIRNNVPLTLLPNGTTYGEPIHVPTVTLARLLPDPPPPCITVGSSGASATGSFYWDDTSTSADDGSTVIKIAAITTGRYKAVSVSAGGGSGSPPLSVATVTALKAVLSASLVDTQPATVQTPGTSWVWSSGTGSGFASDDITVIKSNDVSLGTNGRWYNTSSSPVVSTIAALRLAISGKQERVQVQAYSTLGDGGGGIFIKRTGTPPSDDIGINIVPTGATTFWYEREYKGPIDVRWFGAIVYTTSDLAYAGTDSSAALQAACRVKPITAPSFTVELPYGFIRIASNVEISRRMTLKGQGAGASVLVWDAPATARSTWGGSNFDCLTVCSSTESSDGGDGNRALLKNFTIRNINGYPLPADDPTDPTGKYARGIVVKAAGVKLIGVEVNRAPGRGIQIGQGAANSHFWYVSDIETVAHGDAFFVYYGNAGTARGIHSQGTGARAIVDESDLGNYYFGCYVEAPTDAGYTAGTRASHGGIGGGVNRTLFEGCYSEGGANVLEGPSVWLSGYPVGGFNSSATHGGSFIALSSQEVYPFRMISQRTGDERAHMLFGDVDDNGLMWAVESPSPFSSEHYGLYYRQNQGFWRFCRANDDGDTAFAVTAYGNDRRWGQLHVPALLVGTGSVNGVRVTSGAAAPSSGIWYLGDRHLHSDPATGEPGEWVCTTRGGWGSARANTHAYGYYELITVAGRVYECVVSGTSAGAPPVFDFSSPDALTTDGGATWRFHGVEPPVFDAVYSNTLLSTTRVLKGMPAVAEADADVDEFGRVSINAVTGVVVKIPLEVPNGATLTGITLRVIGGGNAALPANMPGFNFRILTLSGNTTSGSGPQSDASANAGAYNAEHTIAMTGLSSVIDNAGKRYVIEFFGESGANATTGYTIIGATVTFTPASPDRGAA